MNATPIYLRRTFHLHSLLFTCSRWICSDWAILWHRINNGLSIIATASFSSTILKIVFQTSRSTIVYYWVHISEINTPSKSRSCKHYSHYAFWISRTLQDDIFVMLRGAWVVHTCTTQPVLTEFCSTRWIVGWNTKMVQKVVQTSLNRCWVTCKNELISTWKVVRP